MVDEELEGSGGGTASSKLEYEIRHTETMILCAYRIPVGQIVKEHQGPISSSRNEKFVGCIRK